MYFDWHYKPADSLNWQSVDRVVVIQGKNLGDGLLMVPFIEQLLAINPTLEITIILNGQIRPMLEGYDRITCVSYPSRKFDLCSVLWAIPRRGTIFIDLHPKAIHRIFAWCRRFSVITGLRLSKWPAARFDTHSLPAIVRDRKTYQSYMDVIRRLGVVCDFNPINSRFYNWCVNVRPQADLPNNYIVVHPGSRWMFKSLSPSQWYSLFELLGRRYPLVSIVITGGDSPMEVRLGARLSALPNVCNLVGSTDIKELSAVLAHAQGYIGVDTFASHLASLLMVPGVVIFGPSSIPVWGPVNGSRLIVSSSERSEFPCMPCNNDGCGGGKVSMCIASMSIETIVDQLDSVMALNHQ